MYSNPFVHQELVPQAPTTARRLSTQAPCGNGLRGCASCPVADAHLPIRSNAGLIAMEYRRSMTTGLRRGAPASQTADTLVPQVALRHVGEARLRAPAPRQTMPTYTLIHEHTLRSKSIAARFLADRSGHRAG